MRYGIKERLKQPTARRYPKCVLHRGSKPSLQNGKRKKLPIDFDQHFFFNNGLLFITEVFISIWECSQVIGNKMELRKKSNRVRISDS